jgi:predicted nucleic acid-binding protein
MNYMTEASKPIFLIDSNILVYAYDNTDAQKHKIANKLIEKCWRKEVRYAVSVQNLAEFFIIVTKKVPNPLAIEKAEHIISDILGFSNWHILHYDQHSFRKAIALYKTTTKHFWDAMITATMLQSGIFNIYTENVRDFESYENIVVVNPFGK